MDSQLQVRSSADMGLQCWGTAGVRSDITLVIEHKPIAALLVRSGAASRTSFPLAALNNRLPVVLVQRTKATPLHRDLH